jgi:hypothetical protein
LQSSHSNWPEKFLLKISLFDCESFKFPPKNVDVNSIIDANLIRLFDFYLLMMFIIGVIRRWGIYKNVTILTVAVLFRQPNLVRRLGANRDLILNRTVIFPVAIALLLMMIQLILSRLIWPTATVTLRDESESWWRIAMVIITFVPMLCVDIYFLFRVGRIDRGEAFKQLHRAEYWLTSWQGQAVSYMTFGLVNPRKMVDEQLRDGLTWFRTLVAWSMWWVVIQVTLRVTFGVVVWLLWAFT